MIYILQKKKEKTFDLRISRGIKRVVQKKKKTKYTELTLQNDKQGSKINIYLHKKKEEEKMRKNLHIFDYVVRIKPN